MKTQILVFVVASSVALLVAGCQTITLENLRSETPYRSSYRCNMGYQDVFRYLIEGGTSKENISAAQEGTEVQRFLYPESRSAVIYRQFDNAGTGGVQTCWLIDLAAAESGTEIHVYGAYPAQWSRADAIIRKLPNIQVVSSWAP